MNKKITMVAILLALLTVSNTAFAMPKVNDILKQIDFMEDLKTDGTAQVTMTQQKTGEGIKVYEAIYYRRDKDDSFLLVFTAPEIEKGNGYMRIDDNMWVYRRNTRTFQHMNRDESIAGTDSKSEDYEKRKLIELYKPVLDKSGKEIISETTIAKIPVYQFDVQAKVEDVSYPKVTFWVRQDNFLPLKTQSYSLSGTLMETAYFINYTQIEGKYLWIKARFDDEFEKGNKTLVEIKNISIKKIDDYVFTKAYLENLSK